MPKLMKLWSTKLMLVRWSKKEADRNIGEIEGGVCATGVVMR